MASELSMILQRRKAEEDRVKLQEQLRHADRLATIGQISAGVAHELNEPLGSILGFAQLAMKHAEVPAPVIRDLHKIEAASLHARAPCSSSERAAPARSWLREPSTTAARGPRPPSFR
ncbi:MAG: hypothetical protein FJ125_07015 [Deltaproteobacteria bacterium]|nr:hypothetical protein [Deltaproteobacteria bacterium]